MTEDCAIEVRGLTHRYAGQPALLQGLTLTVARGSIAAVLGPNGRGKTTLLKLLVGALRPRQGEIRLAAHAAFVPQLFDAAFPYRVLDMVLMGRARQIGLFALPGRRDEALARAALARLGLLDLAEQRFDALSGGQRQLVVFARALASGAEILVLDEPSSALDLHNQGVVLRWMRQLADEGLTILFTTHHPQHALAVADHALLLFGPHEWAWGPSELTLSEAHLARLYDVDLCRVAFRHGGVEQAALVPVYDGLTRAAAHR